MATDLAINVGRRIKARRLELKLNQRQLAALIPSDAVDNQRISDWERGVNQPSARYMSEIAEALKRPVAWFFEEESAGTPDLMAALPSSGDDSARLVRIEDKLDELLAHLSATQSPEDEVLAEVEAEGQRRDQQQTPPAPASTRKKGSGRAA